MSLLIITAAIDIAKEGVPLTQLTDTQARFLQYRNALKNIIINVKHIESIIFCDNTQFQWEKDEIIILCNKHKKKIEFLSFLGDKHSIKTLGKGYGEGEIMKYVLEKSRLIHNYSSFFKLTGRVTVKNFDAIIVQSTNDTYFNTYSKEITGTDNVVSTVFYKTDVQFYMKYLLNAYKTVNDNKGLFIEKIFHKILATQNEKKIECFEAFPLISGVSGSTGLSYDLKGINLIKGQFLNSIGVFNLKPSIAAQLITKTIGILKRLKTFNNE